MEAESPCAASDLAVARRELLSGNHRELDPVGLRQTWLDLHESWLIDKADEIGIADASGFAIVGVGGLGRRELLPYSDLDVLLLHDGKPADILRPVADRLWYPLWDANIRLDHSVRTVSEALTIANSDLMAALGMLEARHIAGDQQLSFALIDGVRRQWRNGIRSRMGELVEMTYARWRRCGRIAQRAEPDLKLGRGGLRDVQLLDALALAQLIDRHGIGHTDLPAGSLDGAYRTLLDVRTELHRVSGRGRDHLLAQFADEISAALGFGDRFDLARTLSSAGRTIGYHAEAGLRTAANALPRRGISALVRRPKRRPLDEGVVEYAGEIVLARDAEPEHGAELVIPVCTRLGLSPPDVRTLSKLVRHHLLLPITATRRDLNDPKTIEAVSEALGGDPQLLEVLHALSEADSKATGPGVWSDWKASLVDDLVRRCRMVMAGESLPQAEPTAPHYLSLAADHGVHVEISPRDGERIDAVIVAPDERGLVSKAAAVLALNSLRVHSASVNVHQGVAITEFVVSPLFGSPPAAELVRQQFVGALNGDVDVLGMLQKRDSDAASLVSARAGDVQAGVPVTRTAAPPRILWLDTAAPAKLILEVRAMDRAGLLALLAGALEGAGAGIVWAKVNTFGSTAADVFCVTVPAELDARAAVEQHLLEVLGASVDVVVDEPVGD